MYILVIFDINKYILLEGSQLHVLLFCIQERIIRNPVTDNQPAWMCWLMLVLTNMEILDKTKVFADSKMNIPKMHEVFCF